MDGTPRFRREYGLVGKLYFLRSFPHGYAIKPKRIDTLPQPLPVSVNTDRFCSIVPCPIGIRDGGLETKSQSAAA